MTSLPRKEAVSSSSCSKWRPPAPTRKAKGWKFLAEIDDASQLIFACPKDPSSPSPSHAAFTPMPPLGYLAFAQTSSTSTACTSRQEKEIQEETDQDAAWDARVKRDTELHEQQLALEEAEARKGEEIWVRMGGVLRDKDGSRDWARTDAIRKELELRDIEADLKERWRRYEHYWKALAESSGPVKFEDIPWPVDKPPGEVNLCDMKRATMDEFFLGDLAVRDCKTTRKDRIRGSLLRWHPDKLTGLLVRVVEGDVDRVTAGVRLVVECLQRLNAQL